MDLIIIDFVKTNRFLYDKSETGYRDFNRKEQAWSLLAKQLNTTIHIAKQRWATLRDTYVRNNKKIQMVSATHAPMPQPWKYMSNLLFLSDCQKKDTNLVCSKSRTEKCRICLIETNNPTTDLKNVFHNFVDGENFHQIYEYCIGTALDTDISGVSNGICKQCETNLVNSFKFKKQCLETDRIIRQEFNNKGLIYTIEIDDFEQNIKNEGTIELVEKDILENAYSNESSADSIENVHEPIQIETNISKSKRSKSAYIRLKILCFICGKMVTDMTNHMLVHKPVVNEPLKCNVCGSLFKSKGTLRIHQRKHKNLLYECPYCEQKFICWKTKTRHVANYHTGEARFTCSICNAKFSVSANYKNHLKTHTGERILKVPCTYCDQLFENNYKLKLHLTSHSDERTMKCDQCDKSFKHKSSLSVHMRSHTGVKNYECPVCSMAFYQNLLLKGHVRRKHPDYQLPPAGTIMNKNYLKKIAGRIM